MMKKTVAVILAAGEGKRMKSSVPKIIQPICGRPMLDYTLDSVRSAGVKKILVVVGSRAETVKRSVSGKGVEFVMQARRLGTADAVLRTKTRLASFKGDILVLYGDTPLIKPSTIKSLIDAHKKKSAYCTMLTAYLSDPKGYGRIVRDAGGDIERIVEEWDLSAEEAERKEINPGFYCFRSPDIFSVLKKVKAGNRKKEYYLTDAVSLLSKRDVRVESLNIKDADEMLGVNSQGELSAAERIIRGRVIDGFLSEGVRIVDPSNTYIDADVTIGKDTVIFPMTVIEKDVRIGNGCKVGPFARLRSGTVLADGAEVGNFAEVVRARIGRDTKIKHKSYTGDSVIGAGVNIGAGTITANFDGIAKNKTTIADGAFIGSGTIFIAPCSVGKGATTGAGSVVTGDSKIRAGSVVVGVPARELKKTKRVKK